MIDAIEKLARLKESEVGATEANVKQKIAVPLLEALDFQQKDLEFEYRTKSGERIDIFIKNVPRDCKILIDTKNYNVDLRNCTDQIKKYLFDESALLAVLINGSEIRIYSPLGGIDFERSLLYLIKREELTKESVWRILSDFLHKDNVINRLVIENIKAREKEIRVAVSEEDRLKEEYEDRTKLIENDIKSKEREILQRREEQKILENELKTKKIGIWNKLGLPSEVFDGPHRYFADEFIRESQDFGDIAKKARKIILQELVNAGVIRDGQTIFFHNTRTFKDEVAQIASSQNKIKYKADGKLYSLSELAKRLLIKHGFKHDDHGVAGPKYWKTEDGKLINELNEDFRKQRGDRL